MHDVGTMVILLPRHECLGDDVLLRRGGHLVVRQLTHEIEVEDEGVVARLEEDLSFPRAQVVDAAVTDVRRGDTRGMEADEGEGGARSLAFTRQLVELGISLLQRLIEHAIVKGLTLIELRRHLLSHRLADEGTRHLASLMSSHAIAHHEELRRRFCCLGGDEIRILLIGPFAQFVDEKRFG